MVTAILSNHVLIDDLWPESGISRNSVLVLAGSVLLALSAQISINLPFSPVPITFQTFAVLLLGLVYGRNLSVITILTYLTMGVSGIPVFSGAASGFAVICGPTGGYIVGFILAVYTVGLLAENAYDRSPFKVALCMFLGNALIYIPGLIWLSFFISSQNLITAGLLPFIPGDVVKLFLTMYFFPRVRKLF
ncbi:MAG: biotin transporter BioY [Candidatus Riflebacteria bacterium]|nr:biotin transporter BioY [Candidatus Riflebacteria bacterium]